MDVIRNKHIKKIKFFLVFFYFLLIASCRKSVDTTDVIVNYQNNKAVSISFISDNILDDLTVHLKNNRTAILGEFSLDENTHTFTPIIPFSDRQEYQLVYLTNTVASFTIENNMINDAPELLAIYPTTDTVPENMLKMYFQFSKPMQEVGKSLDFIKVVDKTTNQEVDVFLQLETELWDREHKILTLWLDPGRIKTDLIPNKERGLPIIEGNEYEIKISKNWKDTNGNTLAKEYTKSLVVKERDVQKPDISNWEIQLPSSGIKDTLVIKFTEPLDFMLLRETVYVQKENGEIVIGQFNSLKKELLLEFIPKHPWEKGNYILIVDSFLEDLAGNNLNHLFDVDLENNTSSIEQTETKSIQFTIQ